MRAVSSGGRWLLDLDGLAVQRHTLASLAGAALGPERSSHTNTYRSLAKEHASRVKARLFAAVAAGILAFTLMPRALRISPVLVVLSIVALGWLGRRKDRPLIEPAIVAKAGARKLTAETVIRAFIAAKLCKENDPITFPQPVARDGKGWLAVVDLPYSSKASDAMSKREDIAAGLDIDECQVFLSRHRGKDGSARRVSLWVADEDPYAQRPPVTPLARAESVDFWKGFPFGIDGRGRLVDLCLMWTSLLIGSLPRMGKTNALRVVLAAAALAARVKLILADGKGGKDLKAFARVSDFYVSGVRLPAVEALDAKLKDCVADMERRYELLQALSDEECPEGKLTPALARRPGLEPVVIGLDEGHRYLEHPEYGRSILESLVELAKVGPAVGYILVFATQRPDAETVPDGLRGQMGTRLCLRVMTRYASEIILGTGTYAAGLDASSILETHLGVGILRGTGDSDSAGSGGRTIRTHLLDLPTLTKIVDRARELREAAGTITGTAAGIDVTAESPTKYLLDDVRETFRPGEDGLHSAVICQRLAETKPDAYDGWEAADLATQLRPYGVRPGPVWAAPSEGEEKTNRNGFKLAAILEAIGVRKLPAKGSRKGSE
jgi:S-DNA-T family DNA segregation ATPase FtsK/SpoIIIE